MVLARKPVGQPELTADSLVVFGGVAIALILFVTERVPIDVTAILLIVLLVVLEPWTGVDIVQIVREEDRSIAPRQEISVNGGDVLVVRTDR